MDLSWKTSSITIRFLEKIQTTLFLSRINDFVISMQCQTNFVCAQGDHWSRENSDPWRGVVHLSGNFNSSRMSVFFLFLIVYWICANSMDRSKLGATKKSSAHLQCIRRQAVSAGESNQWENLIIDTRNATIHHDKFSSKIKFFLRSSFSGHQLIFIYGLVHPAPTPAQPFNPPQQIRPRLYGFKGPAQHASAQNETKLQDVLEMKCAEITEKESTISLVHSLVEDIERALKTVSDKIMEFCQMTDTQVIPQLPEEAKPSSPEPANDDPTESFR